MYRRRGPSLYVFAHSTTTVEIGWYTRDQHALKPARHSFTNGPSTYSQSANVCVRRERELGGGDGNGSRPSWLGGAHSPPRRNVIRSTATMLADAATSTPAAMPINMTILCSRYTWKEYLPAPASAGWRSTRATPPGAAGLPTVVASSLARGKVCGVKLVAVQREAPQRAQRTRERAAGRTHGQARGPTPCGAIRPQAAAAR